MKEKTLHTLYLDHRGALLCIVSMKKSFDCIGFIFVNNIQIIKVVFYMRRSSGDGGA